jgi:hypothetical protein
VTAVMIALRFDTPKYHSGGVSDVLGQGFPMSWNQTLPGAPKMVGAPHFFAQSLVMRLAPGRVGDLADQLFEHVLQEDDSRHLAVVPQNRGQVSSRALHRGKDILDLV